MIALFIVYMVICAIFAWVGSPNIRLEQELIFQLFGTIIVASTLFLNKTKPMNKNGVSRWFGIFTIYTVVLFLLAGCNIGASVMFNTLISALIYFCVLQLDVKHTRLILKTIVLIAIANTAYVAIQLSGNDPFYIIKGSNGELLPTTYDAIGFFGNKAIMGMYMALGIVAGLIITPLSILLMPLIYISKSTGDAIGVITGVLFIVYWLKRKFFVPLVFIMGACALAYVQFVDAPMGMMGTRPPLWRAAIHDTLYGLNLNNTVIQSPFVKNAFTGFGPDNFRTGNIKYFSDPENNNIVRGYVNTQGQLVDYKGTPFTNKPDGLYTPENKRVDFWDNPHNAIVECFFNYGFIGLTIVGFIFFHIWKRFYNSIKTPEVVTLMALIVTFMMFTISQFPFSVARIAHLVPVILGLFVLNTEDNA